MPTTWDVAVRLMEHCLGLNEPSLPMLRTGQFSDGWVERYLELMDEAKSQYAELTAWPRGLVASAYHASVYAEKRYRDWRSHGNPANSETESALQRIKWATDSLILGWVWHQMPVQITEESNPKEE